MKCCFFALHSVAKGWLVTGGFPKYFNVLLAILLCPHCLMGGCFNLLHGVMSQW